MTNSIGEITGAQAILVIGSNTTETHPVISYRIREAVRKGAVLIVADPREIALVDIATYHLRLKPGTNVALINGLLNIIISEDLVDVEFIEKRTEGYERLKKVVAKYTPEYTAGSPACRWICAGCGPRLRRSGSRRDPLLRWGLPSMFPAPTMSWPWPTWPWPPAMWGANRPG